MLTVTSKIWIFKTSKYDYLSLNVTGKHETYTWTKIEKKTSTSKTSVAPSVVFYWNGIEEFSAFSTIKNKHFHVENVRINQFLYWNGMEDIIFSSLQQLKIDMFMLKSQKHLEIQSRFCLH